MNRIEIIRYYDSVGGRGASRRRARSPGIERLKERGREEQRQAKRIRESQIEGRGRWKRKPEGYMNRRRRERRRTREKDTSFVYIKF